VSFNLADLSLILFIGLFGVLGFFAGFRKGLVSLIGFALSLVIAVLIASLVTQVLISIDGIANIVAGQQNSLFVLFRRHLNSDLDYISIVYMRYTYLAGGADAVNALFDGRGGDFGIVFRIFVYPLVQSAAVSPIMLNSNMLTARDLFALELAYAATHFMIIIILFIVIRIIVACLSILLKTKHMDDKKKSAGQIAGIIIGLTKGALYVCLVLAFMSLMTSLSFMDRPMQEIESSALVSPIARWTNSVSEWIINSQPENERFERLLEAAGFDTVFVDPDANYVFLMVSQINSPSYSFQTVYRALLTPYQ